jgi:prolyl oligopeptidase
MADHGATAPAAAEADDDPLLWLEEVDGARALDWVRAENAITGRVLAEGAEFDALRARLLAILDAKERIPWIAKRGPLLYNFWQDEQHVKGLWRRTTLADYKRPAPDWETVLDLDHLAAEEKENWVWAGPNLLKPTYDRALINLSRGGADAAVVREFDLVEKRFVDPGPAGGFALPEAKTNVAWRNRDTLYVATDFGAGSLTTSGYPRIIKEWQRGTPLAAAVTVFEAARADMMAYPFVHHDRGHVYEIVVRSVGFYTHEYRIRRGDEWVRVECPADASLHTFADYILLELRSDWSVAGKTYPAGALLAGKFEAYLAGARDLAILFEPGPRKSLAEIGGTRSALTLNELENVRNRIYVLRPGAGGWTRKRMDVPDLGSASAHGLDPDESDDYLLTYTGFTEPTTLSLGALDGGAPAPLKSLPAQFDATGLAVEQFEAVSRDGTRIPYFQIARRDLAIHGGNPTVLHGYGGFEVSLRPAYDGLNGAGWLEKGGVSVVANIRGGGEFGPVWHQAALRQNRQRAYDDFAAVAEDLICRGVTSPRHLGIEGGSNGGLLVGVLLTQRPELFRAVVCSVPLLDMARYHKLLAGASWMEEYGDPDRVQDWAFIRAYSPYHNLAAGRIYPRVLFTTSTRDDRVHPGHARKMAARMKAMGCDVLYYENIEGGHGGAADNRQRAHMQALAFSFLWRELS